MGRARERIADGKESRDHAISKRARLMVNWPRKRDAAHAHERRAEGSKDFKLIGTSRAGVTTIKLFPGERSLAST